MWIVTLDVPFSCELLEIQDRSLREHFVLISASHLTPVSSQGHWPWEHLIPQMRPDSTFTGFAFSSEYRQCVRFMRLLSSECNREGDNKMLPCVWMSMHLAIPHVGRALPTLPQSEWLSLTQQPRGIRAEGTRMRAYFPVLPSSQVCLGRLLLYTMTGLWPRLQILKKTGHPHRLKKGARSSSRLSISE